MNILIVDDEIHIREGLRRTIESAFQTLNVHTADSAEAALDKLRDVPVDIVIADIMMNGMTGLELIAAGKVLYKRIHWIILSAHSDFHFAQEALRQGARDYLLKPIGKSKLIELLTRLQAEIKQDEIQLSDEELLSRNLRLMRESVFQRFAAGMDIGPFNISKLAEQYPSFYLVMINLQQEKEASLFHFMTENIVTEMVEAGERGVVFSLDQRTVIALVSATTEPEPEPFIQELTEILDRCLKRAYGIHVSQQLMSDFRDIPSAIRALRSLPAQTHESEPTQVEENPSGAIPIAIQYIQAHYQDELSLEKVAAAVYLNAAYFSQLFKQKMGQGYKEYVIRLRMDKAAEILQQTNMKITEVAYQVGYQELRHFTQVFRKTFQVTPTEYRQNNHQGEV
ncbi:DNA-binding response regulator [Paenibacillus baekrokdamisoli]|uniref:DNA-binding response regulator n=1 Tax=Paenibacillus baekrokdamisoli TaxID=1712516 RepID=A0A3G9IPZ2_9BACL|nr:response regulator [Paenibacillus baekrokdamisoli]MBB3072041.1 two-component system response regulator YesN [Paenibacillus baekrokdamisoli]BBH20342.1 DNA-binding response regulator [Paenibacillus baekrokdamisoli]